MIEIGENLALVLIAALAALCVVGVAWAAAYSNRKGGRDDPR
jgi:hypothetical protein